VILKWLQSNVQMIWKRKEYPIQLIKFNNSNIIHQNIFLEWDTLFKTRLMALLIFLVHLSLMLPLTPHTQKFPLFLKDPHLSSRIYYVNKYVYLIFKYKKTSSWEVSLMNCIPWVAFHVFMATYNPPANPSH
jgi:hypothetical protein